MSDDAMKMIYQLQEEIRVLREKIAEMEGASILDKNAIRIQRERAEEAEKQIARIQEWTHSFGPTLIPKNADTFGEGMREAKEQVSRLLASK